MQYQPKLLVDEQHASPRELEMHEELSPTLQEWAVDELLLDDIMVQVELIMRQRALRCGMPSIACRH